MTDHQKQPAPREPMQLAAEFLRLIHVDPYPVQLEKLRDFAGKIERTHDQLGQAIEGLEAIVKVQVELSDDMAKPPKLTIVAGNESTQGDRAYLIPRPGKGNLSVREKALLVIHHEGPKSVRELAEILFGAPATTDQMNRVRSALFPSKKQKLLLIKKKRYSFATPIVREDLLRSIEPSSSSSQNHGAGLCTCRSIYGATSVPSSPCAIPTQAISPPAPPCPPPNSPERAKGGLNG